MLKMLSQIFNLSHRENYENSQESIATERLVMMPFEHCLGVGEKQINNK
jgi:hypothetical protein